MAGVNSNTCCIYIDTAAGTVSNDPAETSGASPALVPIAYSTSAGVSINNATFEVNYKKATGATASDAPSLAPTRAFNVGTQTASMSFEGVVDWTVIADTIALNEIFNSFLAKSQITACWASTDTNANAYHAKGYITSFDLSSSVDDFATFSGSIELIGDITELA